MEELLLIVIGLGVLCAAPTAVALAVTKRRLRRERETTEKRLAALTQRIHRLEQENIELSNVLRLQTQAPSIPQAGATVAPSKTEKAAAAPHPSRPVPSVAPSSRMPVAEPISPGPPVIPASARLETEAPAPHFVTTAPAFSDRFRSALNLEETLGANWLNKLGVVILVIGVFLFLGYEWRQMGAAGKIILGYLVSAVLLGGGVFLERRERYRIFARAAIGGGWAMLYATTYAMHHLPAARVLASQAIDLVLLLVVAAAMVLHTLRYRSQVVTGLALLLGFITVTISHNNVYSLTASAILAVALVTIVRRMRWFELEIFGILATYLNHFFWLRPIIEPMGKHHHMFPEFRASAGLLCFYWLVFRSSYVFRRIDRELDEKLSTAAALLNVALLLGVMRYQTVRPELAFWFLLVVGAVEMLVSRLSMVRQRREAFMVLATLGAILLVAAFPFRYSGGRLSVLWLVEAEALLFAGVINRELVFRWLGKAASLALGIQMLGVDAARVFGERMDEARVVRELRLAAVFAAAAIVFYLNSHWVPRRWSEVIRGKLELHVLRRFSYAAGVLALVGLWIGLPGPWTAVAWGALALLLAIASTRSAGRELAWQANILAAAALVRVLAINLHATEQVHHLTLRLITVSLVAVLFYLTSRWSGAMEWLGQRGLPAAYTWVGSTLVALLMWYELRPIAVALAWMLFGIVLLELAISRNSTALRLQGYVALASSFLRMLFVNLNEVAVPGQISPRFYTVVPLALAYYYAYRRVEAGEEQLLGRDRVLQVPQIFCWMGTITIAALMRFEIDLPDWIAAAWAALVLVLAAVAWRTGKRIFLHQAMLLAFAAMARAVLHNFYERSYFPPPRWESRWLTVGTPVALLFAVLPIAFRVRETAYSTARGFFTRITSAFDRHPEQVFFFIPLILVTVLLALEMRFGMVTVSWGIEAVAVFLFALRIGQRSYRLSGLALLLLSVGKILVVDVWRLNPRDRYITFIILGCALLLVSFLYSRHREAVRQYL